MHPISGSPFLRALVIVVPGLLVALYLAAQIGYGNLPTTIYFLLGVIFLVGVKIFTKRIRFEGLVLGVLLFGYIVGQSGFGHFSISPRQGIYLGEIGLMICLGVTIPRIAFTRERIIPKQPLAWAIFAFIAIGTLRFIYDLRHSINKVEVVRDFATIYYVVFFFIAFNVCRHPGSRLFLRRAITVALICSIFVSSIFFVVPSVFNHLVVHGRPIVEPRGDLTGSFMGFACVLFFLNGQTKGHPIRWTILSFAAFIALLIPLSRATFLGFAAAVIILMLSGQPKFLLRLVIFCVVGIMTLTPILLAVKKTGEETYATRLRDKILSIVEPFGVKHAFSTEAGEVAAGNNEFRAAWWKSVIDETNEKSPIVGMGFGYDLAKRFLLSYTNPLNQYEFDVRSPHSIILTVYGRMGIIGILAFFLVVFYILRSALRCAAAIRSRKTPPLDIALWCGVIAILITSCFGVMLEGPMAAIVFWSLLGMASYREWERLHPAPAPATQQIQGRLMRPAPSPVASRAA
jgi:O-antigen ligase